MANGTHIITNILEAARLQEEAMKKAAEEELQRQMDEAERKKREAEGMASDIVLISSVQLWEKRLGWPLLCKRYFHVRNRDFPSL